VAIFVRSAFLFCLVLLSIPALASSGWQQPTPDELKMTADPAAPDAAAVFLYREETVDDQLHNHTLYVRMKILTEKGRELADVEMPTFDRHSYNITNIEGRTIHSDGTIIPFTGKPYDKILVKTKTVKYQTKVFTLPDVEVGSILEYRYVLRYEYNWVHPPRWYLQQAYFVHKAHYLFVPSTRSVRADGGGEASQVLYTKILPDGKDLTYIPKGGRYDLDIDNIPPVPAEEYTPPMNSLTYRVLFYYSADTKADEYWDRRGKIWKKNVDQVVEPTRAMKDAVEQIIHPSDVQLDKLQKLYAAVMTVENTRFTRQHTAQENKAQGITTWTLDDIWRQKRGTDDEIALLFLSMVRATGMNAYAMAVSERDRTLFTKGYLEWDQLDNIIVIVPVNGKEVFFDPGQRYCAFGKLGWKNSNSKGVRETDNGTVIAETPSATYSDTKIARTAILDLDGQGKITGIVRISLSGADAMRWRQRALETDETQLKKEFEDELQSEVPVGILVKTNHFLALTDYNSVLLAVMDVTGSMGTTTGKRVFLPSSFFQASVKPLFIHDKRQNPIEFDCPFDISDNVEINLPPTLTVESVPENVEIPYEKLAVYVVKYQKADGKYAEERRFILGNTYFPVEKYATLKDFYQKLNAQDQEQVMLNLIPPAATLNGQ
jgi:hypothetical protein